MHCAHCHSENRVGAKFCNECGTPFPRRCAACGTETPTGAKFCHECGTSLTGKSKSKSQKSKSKSENTKNKSQIQTPELLTSQPSDTGRRTPDTGQAAERRQLTVMFCDLVDSTALSARLDPEDLREVIRRYQELCAEVVQRFDGTIAQYLGDGVLVYFGYPTAHEDDAYRAVRAGLEIVTAVQRFSSPSPSQGEGWGEGSVVTQPNAPHPNPLPEGARELKVRIGIHTGPVVVGEIGGGTKREHLALGETPNIAASLQGIAAPNTVAVSAATYHLVSGFFDCQSLGAQSVKGIATPIEAYHVLAQSVTQHRLDAVPVTGLTPLVGREEELALLHRRWEHAKDREGQVVVLSGEPGIGKSRLVRELRTRVEQDQAIRIEFRCSPYYQNSAFHPVIEHLQHLVQWQKEETHHSKLDKLRTTLAQYRFPQPDTLALFAALLSLSPPADAPSLNLSPQRQKQKTEEALIAWLLEEADRAPLYCAWEDLHWADPSTLELLGQLITQTATARLFLLLTSRPEFTPPWGRHGHVSQLTLSRLGRRQAPQMIENIVGGKSLPADVVQQIVAKTDGVPLFVEELTKMVVESGLLTERDGHYELRGPLPPLAIPATLQDSLMARLDRLASVRELAQLGAAIGREFSYELLHAVSPLDEQTLQHGLHQLVETELIYQRGTPPHATYFFKHALIQDTAYQSLLKSTRHHYHTQIAHTLEERFPAVKASQPELLAHHYTEAGLIEQAIPYWQQAGERAVQRSANSEAVSHITKGLVLLETLPDTLARAQRELTLQIVLESLLMVTKGYAAPEVAQASARALDLCQRIGETPQLFSALMGSWGLQIQRAKHTVARELGERLVSLAYNVNDQTLLSQAHYALGTSLFYSGEFPAAQMHLKRGEILYDPQFHHSHLFFHGRHTRLTCLTLGALTLWFLGYPDQALAHGQEALALAQQLSHPFRLAWTLKFTTMLYQYRQEEHVVREQAEAMIALSTDQGFPYWLALGTVLQGRALAERGQAEKGIAQIRQGMDAFRATGAELASSYWFALLAEAHEKGGQIEEGLASLAKALVFVDRTGERLHAAELYRLKGELTLQSSVQSLESRVTEAEVCFLKALDISRTQQAKSLELRAATSLARLWRQQGKRAEAHKLLSEVYNWFTEGFDTKDLQEAKALLTELGEGS